MQNKNSNFEIESVCEKACFKAKNYIVRNQRVSSGVLGFYFHLKIPKYEFTRNTANSLVCQHKNGTKIKKKVNKKEGLTTLVANRLHPVSSLTAFNTNCQVVNPKRSQNYAK